MLYTRNGDSGKTKMFNTPKGERVSKGSAGVEALGALDELNSFLGLLKIRCSSSDLVLEKIKIEDIILDVQDSLFTIQAEVAGSEKRLADGKVKKMESEIQLIEDQLPRIKTFIISGGTELGVLFDYSRTLARKAERRIVSYFEISGRELSSESMAYINRISSLLYALARLSNHKSGINEFAPTYGL